MIEIDIIWQQCQLLLKDQFGERDYNTWFAGLKVMLVDGKLNVVAANRLVLDFIQTRYWERIKNILNELTEGLNLSIELSVDVNNVPSQKSEASNMASKLGGKPQPNSNRSSKSSNISKELEESLQQATKLNPHYTFDTLVRGNSNQLAYAIGMHITQKPGHKSHNPLFIYGGVGLGKTHLMQAIGNEVYRKNPKAKIRYLHANDYIQDVVKASMRQGFDELKKYYGSLDLLLMDDIQFIAGDKTKSQEEFFYTFNTLLERNRQIIMTCDTYPKNIGNLNERLISRFASGLTVEVQPPELEMRVAILKRKALQHLFNLDDEVAFFIAQNIKSNVRELEGALNKVMYHAQFSGKTISLNIAKEALMDILAIDSRSVSIDDIQKIICEFYKIKLSDLLSAKRAKVLSRPRQIAMALAKELTQYSLPFIGSAFGGRDHSTVIHAYKTIIALRKADEKVEREYNLLIQLLNN